MAKRGLGRGLDALIPEKTAAKPIKEKTEKKVSKKKKEKTQTTEGKPVKEDDADTKEAVVLTETDASVPENKPQEEEYAKDRVVNMRISLVEPNRDQPRKYFDEEAIAELSDSIRQFGIIQPLIVQKKDDYYEIIAGERRWRAAKKAGLKEIPVIIRDYSRQEAVEVALIENIQREDLNPIEEAKAYEQLVKEYGLSQEAVAERVSRSRSAVTNSLRLLKLDPEVQTMVETAQISEGHARAILGLASPVLQKEAAQAVLRDHLSVRQTEKMVKGLIHPPKAKKTRDVIDELMLNDLAEKMKSSLGTKVSIKASTSQRGKIEIEYYSEDELDRLYELLLSAGR